MSDNRPISGCDGCNTTGGRASCPLHRGDGTGWLGDSFAEIGRLQTEIERLQGLLAEQDREFNAENLRTEKAERDLLDARAQEESWKILANRANERADQFEQERELAYKEIEETWTFTERLKGQRDQAERERDEARKALEWVWDHFDCRAFQSDAYHGDPVPDWIVELVQRLWAARVAEGGGDE